MTTPDPSPPDPKSILTALIDAFNGLEPILRYGGLITIVGVVILWLTGVFPEIFLLYPALALVAYLFYALYNRHLDDQARQLEYQNKLDELKEIHRHKEATIPSRPQGGPETAGEPIHLLLKKEKISTDEWQRRYMEYLVQLCGYPPYTALIDIREAGIKVTRISLERIYTNLDVPASDHLRRLPDEAMTDPDILELAQLEEQQREPVLAAISRPENKHLVILGAPGSGKSTLVSYLALCLAGDYLGRADINQARLNEQGWDLSHLRLIPVLVTLRQYAAEGLSQQQDLWTYITTVLTHENLAGYVPHLKKQLSKGCLLLLDGLDEVDNSPQVRQALQQQIERFAREFSNVRIVVTSRPYAYGAGWELNRFAVTRLLDFSPEQIDIFIDQWYTVTGQEDRTLGPDKAKEYAESLKNQVNPRYQRTHNLRELARNPLLLTMMVYIHRGREGGKLPHRREELYRLCITLLLELWQRSKNINLLDELHITGEQLEKALQEVAFAAHKDQPTLDKTADISGELLAGKLYKYRGQDTAVAPDRLIEYVRDRAGLLQQHHTKASEDDDDLYRFPHRTFQEYLAGLYLLRYDFPKELARLSREDPNRWREALLLGAASQRHVPYTVWALIEKLCPEPPPAPDQAQTGMVWGAFLAGQIFVETDLLNPETTLDEDEVRKKERIRQWQRTIVSDGLLPPRDQAQAGDVLAELGDDRPGVLACDEMRFCTVPAGEFWMADKPQSRAGRWLDILDKPYWLAQVPVTVAQFRQFVQESGFEPRYGEIPLRAPENRPVVFVNWYDALAFCDWLTQRWRPHLPPGYRVTLPNEAEWEKAARGGRSIPVSPHITTIHGLKAALDAPPAAGPNERDGRALSQREYPWGDELEQEEIEPGQFLYRANSEVAGIGRASAVGSFPAGASPVGCLDMSGNVWEWTRSFYNKDRPYRLSPDFETISPHNQKPMLLCGGSFYVNSPGCSARGRNIPVGSFSDYNGFRVAVSPFVSER